MSIADNLRLYWRVYLRGGVVGIYYFAAMLRARRRVQRVVLLKMRERELHKEHMRTLEHEFKQAVSREQDTKVRAASYWRAVRGEVS